MITVDRVSFTYEGNEAPALSEMTVAIHQGDWLTVLGKNGSGKSTLGRLLNGLLLPTEGTVQVDSLLTNDEMNIWNIRRKVGMIFQNPEHQFVATTVRDDIAFGLENLGLERETIHERIEHYAHLIGVTSFLQMEPHRLSGGQKQRVAIASVMAMEPEVIVFDEATAMLDPIGRKDVLDTMKQLHKQGCTIVSITHHMEEALLGNRVVLLEQGKKIADYTPLHLFENDALIQKTGLRMPFVLDLQKKLEQYGQSVSKRCLTGEELIFELWTSSSKK